MTKATLSLTLDADLVEETDKEFDRFNLTHILKWFCDNHYNDIKNLLIVSGQSESDAENSMQEFGLGSLWLYELGISISLRLVESRTILTLETNY